MNTNGFINRLNAALDELEERVLTPVKAGVSADEYRKALGYFEALRDVRAEVDVILKKFME